MKQTDKTVQNAVTEQTKEDILEAANIGLWELEFRTGREPRLIASPAMLNLMGIDDTYSPEAVFFYHKAHVYGEDSALFQVYSDEIIANEKAEIVYRWVHPSMGLRYVRCSGFLKEKSTAGIFMNGYHQDITDIMSFRKEQEEKLADVNAISKQRMDIIMAYSSIYFMSWIVNVPEDRIVNIKKPSFDYDEPIQMRDCVQASSLVEEVCSSYIADEYQEAMKEFLDYSTLQDRIGNQERLAIEYRGKLKEWCRQVAIPLSYDEDGNLREVLMAVQEITAQKKKELENMEALEFALADARAANNAKTDFLSRMSHDVRTPLNGILGMVNIARANLDNRIILKDALEKIDEAGKQLEMLIGDVLDMSRLERGKTELTRERFDIYHLLKQCGELEVPLALELGIHLLGAHVNIVHNEVIGSPIHLMRVVQNLLSNAIKYNKKAGSLETWLDEIRIDRDHSLYRFKIQDTGIGMSEEFQKIIFEPFSQEKRDARTEFRGSGLGMAITKELVNLMNGRIWFESVIGEGTTFYVEIPFEVCHMTEKTVDESIVETRKIDFSGRNILLAEDNALNRQIAEYLLIDAGATVTTAENGREAMDLFEGSAVGEYDLILMDVMMPEINGLEATRRIRAMKHPDALTIPIVAMTANVFAEDIQKGQEAGMNAHISKPIDVPTMMKVLGELLEN